MCIHCMGTCRGSGRYFSLSLLYIYEYRGVLREVGIGNVYDPHPCYYTLYGCRVVLRVREVLVMCMTITTVIIYCRGIMRVREVLVMCITLTTVIIHCMGVGTY